MEIRPAPTRLPPETPTRASRPRIPPVSTQRTRHRPRHDSNRARRARRAADREQLRHAQAHGVSSTWPDRASGSRVAELRRAQSGDPAATARGGIIELHDPRRAFEVPTQADRRHGARLARHRWQLLFIAHSCRSRTSTPSYYRSGRVALPAWRSSTRHSVTRRDRCGARVGRKN